ncbi:1-phosphofructokinase [Paratractidigestivibacter sp.]|uniref:1-phosphofructokinase n=1 Tax=Paratractidigestivibacter sp. TaxID=2847316 RepID=UPI002ABDADDB|nr:1-phosphofructokinase [Paratractidigestivibacter sp.]
MLHTVTLNPALDKTATVGGFAIDAVNRITELREDAGGKGINVSKVCAKLGTASLAHMLLAGQTGKKIEQAIQAMGIEARAFEVAGETRTNLKIVDPRNHTNTDVNEPGPQVSATELAAFAKHLTDGVSQGDVVVLAGSLSKGASEDTYALLVQSLRSLGAKVFLDADGEPLRRALKARPYLIKPNDHELAGLVGHELKNVGEIVDAAKELVGSGIERVVVSMGGEGALFVTAERVLFAHAPKVKVGSTVGAGDSVVAALAHAEGLGMPLEEAARLAVATGSANVMCSGTQAAELEAVQGLIDQVTIEELA